jgi:cobalamin biosynthesis protein CbiG
MAPGQTGDALVREEAMVACGIGCRRGAPVEDIEAAINAARKAVACDDVISIVATEKSKLDEPGLHEAARRLGVALVGYEVEALNGVSKAVLTVSSAAQRYKGVSSVAEAAALLAAGNNATLLGPREAVRTATCALAVGGGS